MWWTPSFLARRRVLQCVHPSVGFLRVQFRIRASAIDPTRDLPVGHPLGQQEQDTGDPSIIGSPCPTPRTPLKLGSFLLRQSDRIGSHAIQSNTKLLSVTVH